MKSIKRRVYKQNGIIIISIVVILEFIFLLSVRSYYLESIKRHLINKADISGSFYNRHLINEDIHEKAIYILENDSSNPVLYMQILDTNKKIVIDSNGLKSNGLLNTIDTTEALEGRNSISIIRDKSINEEIMSVAIPLYQLNNISGILIYAISMKGIEKMIMRIWGISILIGIGVIVFMFLLSSFLAKDITMPIKELTSIAEIMAKGDFSKRAVKRNDDEIGKLSETLNYMAEEIQRSNSVKNDFISSISHELRTPLTAIQGWSEIILLGEVENSEEEKEGLKIIDSEAKRLSGLVEQLLDFSKLESGKVTLELQKVHINDLVGDVYGYFKKRFEKSDVEANIDLMKEDRIVKGDVNRLKQVFINIIDNAIKFTKENGTINVRTFLNENFVCIEVEDNGIGIPFKDIQKVTEKFYKGKTKGAGSGIGLAVCKEIVDLHGGELYVSSIEGKGTKIRIELPFINLKS